MFFKAVSYYYTAFCNGCNLNFQNLTVSVRDDTNPELLEKFTLRLVSAQSNDGKKESGPRSGASIDRSSSKCDIIIEENDSPYGLLQFSDSPPRNGSIVPLTDVFWLKTRESVGVLKLYVVRAQGVLGTLYKVKLLPSPLLLLIVILRFTFESFDERQVFVGRDFPITRRHVIFFYVMHECWTRWVMIIS